MKDGRSCYQQHHNVSPSPKKNARSPISPDKRAKLKEALSNRRITPVKSTVPGTISFDFEIYKRSRFNPFRPDITIVIFINIDHLQTLQVENCGSNSRPVVDEDDLMWFKNYRKLSCIGKPVSWKFSF